MLDLSRANASALAQILAFPDARAPWGAEDLGSILQHELRSPWLIHVPEGGSSPSLDMDQSGSGGLKSAGLDSGGLGGSIASLGDLITHANPPRSLLRLAKDHTKHMASAAHANGAVPQGALGASPGTASALGAAAVGRTLYYAVLAAAIARGDRSITTLTDRQLRDGFHWAMTQPGVDDTLYHLLSKADAKLRPDAD